ncbi:hypothetical protein [Bdellovibrio sp.]|uniref:hypothetical protein n=1 Tax=Bdellovibrio sp. TaxID=28201 RepID=UPI0039E6E514
MKSILLFIITTLMSLVTFANDLTPNVKAEGNLYQYNRESEQFDIDLQTPCKVIAKNFTVSQDSIYFEFQILGLPRSLDRYSIGSMRGSAIPQRTFSAKQTIVGGSKNLIVKTSFHFYGTPDRVLQKPRLFSVAVTSYSAIKGVFTGDPVAWGYLCQTTSHIFE